MLRSYSGSWAHSSSPSLFILTRSLTYLSRKLFSYNYSVLDLQLVHESWNVLLGVSHLLRISLVRPLRANGGGISNMTPLHWLPYFRWRRFTLLHALSFVSSIALKLFALLDFLASRHSSMSSRHTLYLGSSSVSAKLLRFTTHTSTRSGTMQWSGE